MLDDADEEIRDARPGAACRGAGGAARAGGGASLGDARARPGRRQGRDRRGAGRHRRRRGRPVRGRPLRDADPLRRRRAASAPRRWPRPAATPAATRRSRFEIRGDGAYSVFKYESGVHRVQRVPATESQGRIHTSTATVAVLPEAEEVEVAINPTDLRIDVYRVGRPRRPVGQHHRLGGAHHPPADRAGGDLPGRALAAPEQGAGDEDPARAAVRGRARARPAGGVGQRGCPRSAAASAARRSAPTTSPRTASPTTASTSTVQTSTGCSPATCSAFTEALAAEERRLKLAARGGVITLAEVLRRSTEYLESHGSPTPRLDAELLLAHGLGLSRIELYTQFDRPLNDDELAACRELVARRGQREPVAYVIGRWGFRELELDVDRRVLVPRPETELVVERCLTLIEGERTPRLLDVGTGSGAIALALKQERPDAEVVACDISRRCARGRPRQRRAAGPGGDVRAVGSAGRRPRRCVLPDRLEPALRRPRPNWPGWSRRWRCTSRGWRRRPATASTSTGGCCPRRRRGWRPAARWCSSAAPARRRALVAELERLGYRDPGVDSDLAGIERVVWATWR